MRSSKMQIPIKYTAYLWGQTKSGVPPVGTMATTYSRNDSNKLNHQWQPSWFSMKSTCRHSRGTGHQTPGVIGKHTARAHGWNTAQQTIPSRETNVFSCNTQASHSSNYHTPLPAPSRLQSSSKATQHRPRDGLNAISMKTKDAQ